MVKETITIKTAEGLHARPAAEFVRIAASDEHSVMISKSNGTRVKLTIEVSGPDEDSLIQSLITVVSGANNR